VIVGKRAARRPLPRSGGPPHRRVSGRALPRAGRSLRREQGHRHADAAHPRRWGAGAGGVAMGDIPGI